MKDKIYGITGLGISFLSAWGASKFGDINIVVAIWLGMFSFISGFASIINFFGGKIRNGYY